MDENFSWKDKRSSVSQEIPLCFTETKGILPLSQQLASGLYP
jgi:hypothetical protein